MDEGLRRAEAEGEREGQLAQLEAGPNRLARRDFGFSASGFNKGARYVYTRQKQTEIEGRLSQIAMDYEHDAAGFRTAFEEAKSELFDEVPGQILPVLNVWAVDKAQQIEGNIKRDTVRFERQVQEDQWATDVDQLIEQAQIEAERDGEISPQTEALFTVLRETGEGMDIMPSVLDKSARLFEQSARTGSIVHGFRRASNKDAYVENLLSDSGPLADMPFTDRISVTSKLSKLQSIENAKTAAAVKRLTGDIREAISTERVGVKSNITDDILEKADSYPVELQDDIDTLRKLSGVRSQIDDLRGTDPYEVASLAGRLQAKEATTGLTVEEVALLDGAQRVQGEQAKAAKDGDLLAYAASAGVVEYTPMDQNGAIDPVEREEAVQTVRELYKRPVGFYSKAELGVFQNVYEKGSDEQRSAIFDQFASQTPRAELPAVLRQLAGEAPEVATVFSLYAGDGRETAESILRGKAFWQTNKESLTGAPELRRQIMEEVGDYIDPALDRSGVNRAGLTEAAFYLAVDRYQQEGRFQDRLSDMSDVKKVVPNILGSEEKIEINGKAVVPFNRGMSEDEVEGIWSTIDDNIIEAIGGGKPVYVSGSGLASDVSAEKIVDDGWYQQVAPGEFVLMLPRLGGGAPVMLFRQSEAGLVPFRFKWSDLERALGR